MEINYNKDFFSVEEANHILQETQHLQEKNPNHIPILIMVKSNLLKIEKRKFLVSKDIVFSNFITNTLRKKLIGLNENDVLTIQTVKLNPENNKSESTELKPNSKTMKYIFEEYKDSSTNILIFKVSRNTTYKYIKNSLKYYAGY